MKLLTEEHLYYMVRDSKGYVHNCKTNAAEPFDNKNVKDYIQWPKDIGGGLLKFPDTTYQLTIIVYVMQKDGKGKYRPKEGDEIFRIFSSP